MSEFKPFPKMARWSRDIVITEKLDGTNAQVYIESTDDPAIRDLWTLDPFTIAGFESGSDATRIMAGSRTRWLDTSSKGDNFGFAKWVEANAAELLKLGEGRHFGEWWGQGIQRGYGLQEKRFSLFNVGRWYDDMNHEKLTPACCDTVPVLYMGPNEPAFIDATLENLRAGGSKAAPGFNDPEGIIIYHTAAGIGFKKTIKDDHKPKGQ